MNIASIMTSPVIGIQPTASIAEAIRLMLSRGVSGLPVMTAEGALVGVVSEGDFLRRGELGTAQKRSRFVAFVLGDGKIADEYVHSHGRRVSEIMSTDVISVSATESLENGINLMLDRSIKRLPVIQDGKVVGIVSRADILHALMGKLPSDQGPVSDSVIRSRVFADLDAQNWINSQTIQVDVKDGAVSLTGTIFDERTRQALIVVAENVPGVKSVTANMLLIEPISGMAVRMPA